MAINENLIIEIKKVLNCVHNGKCKKRSEWTAEFKNALSVLGETNYTVYPNKKDGEWLVDLCWSIEGNDWKKDFRGIKLACEIEWDMNVDEIIYDFQKLTVLDADIRLFIFQYNSEEEYNNTIDAIESACKFTKQKDYTYLIAGSGNFADEIKFKEL